MKPLMPVLTDRAVGARFSMDRKTAIWRCWGIWLKANQPSLVRLTMKSARLGPPADSGRNMRAQRAESTSSKQMGETKRHWVALTEGPEEGAVAEGSVNAGERG